MTEENSEVSKCWFCGEKLDGPFTYKEIKTEGGKREVPIHLKHGNKDN